MPEQLSDHPVIEDPAVDALPDVETTDDDLVPPDLGDSGSAEIIELEAATPLTPQQRGDAQAIIVKGARLLLAHPEAVHYTQGPERWEGISRRIFIRDDKFPKHGDCSSTATWLLWNALGVRFGMGDVVNGEHWRGGFTGTMLNHGRKVPEGAAQVGDLVLYGSGGTGEHVTVCLGGGMAFSHGSEGGPFKVRIRYRNDVMGVRRYF